MAPEADVADVVVAGAAVFYSGSWISDRYPDELLESSGTAGSVLLLLIESNAVHITSPNYGVHWLHCLSCDHTFINSSFERFPIILY